MDQKIVLAEQGVTVDNFLHSAVELRHGSGCFRCGAAEPRQAEKR
jgi:hypothetical protein